MIASDETIRALLASLEMDISPMPADEAFQPASIDLRLANDFKSVGFGYLTSTYDKRYERGYLRLPAGRSVLARTIEQVRIPTDYAGRLEGKSSWGRKFVTVHATAGFIDPGFEGTITLEITNHGFDSVVLPVGCYITQLSLHQLTTPAARPYGHPDLSSHYQGQVETTRSWLEER